MTDVQRRVFHMYVALGPKRSLPAVVKLCKEREVDVTIRQLTRWSSTFKWSRLAELTQQAIANKLADDVMPEIREITKLDLRTTLLLKKRFHRRAQIDPFDKTLPDEDRALAIMPDLADYEKLVNIERKLLGDPDENEKKGLVSRVEEAFDTVELMYQLGERTRKLHGLPPPPDDEEKDVTPETIDAEAVTVE